VSGLVTNYDEGPFRLCKWGEFTVLVLKTDIEARGTLVQTTDGPTLGTHN